MVKTPMMAKFPMRPKVYGVRCGGARNSRGLRPKRRGQGREGQHDDEANSKHRRNNRFGCGSASIPDTELLVLKRFRRPC